MRDVMTIANRAAAAVFASPQQRKVVQTLIGGEFTLAGLAAAAGMPLSLLHYHASKCTKLGLIKVVRTQKRAGCAIKYYRATAKSFFVPAELMKDAPGAEMTQHLRSALDRSMARTVKGVNVTHDGRNPCLFLVKDPAVRRSAVELWLDTGLSAADAAELFHEMEALLQRFRTRGTPRHPKFLVHLAAVKL